MAPRALFDIQPLLAALTSGATVLTPNNRLRNQMRQAYAETVAGAEAILGPDTGTITVVVTPAIFTFSEWIESQWHSLTSQAYPACLCQTLNELQAQTLWQQLFNSNQIATPLGQGSISKLITQLREAQRFLTLWQIPMGELLNSRWHSPESAQLHQWLVAFNTATEKLHAILPEQQLNILNTAFIENSLSTAKQIILQSFDTLAPLQAALLGNAAKQLQHAEKLSAEPRTCIRIAARDASDEYTRAALWAKSILESEPNARIGIVVPNLGTVRNAIEQAFTAVFEPQTLGLDSNRYVLPINISAGVPLASAPIVRDTLQLLRMHNAELSNEYWQQLLHSPFFGDEPAERALRCELLRRIHHHARFDISATYVRDLAQKIAAQPELNTAHQAIALTFSQRLIESGNQHRRLAKNASANEWVNRILEQLALLGWPGARSLDSIEYQQVQQWYGILERFASLETFGQPLTLQQTLGHLQQLASATHFQPEVKYSPIYILGTLEAAGLQFSHCWVLGMDNRNWPPKPSPNTLLPVHLQQHYLLPRCNAAKELEYAAALTAHLRHCADDLVFSYALQADDSPALPSQLIESIAPTPSATTPTPNTLLTTPFTTPLAQHYQLLQQRQTLEWVACHQGPIWPSSQSRFLQGGATLFKDQLLGPFNSFAIHRLGATRFDEPTLGLNAKEKGILVHRIMENIWRRLRNHKNLLALTEDELAQTVMQQVQADFQQITKKDLLHLGDYYYALESERFAILAAQSLRLDRTRPEFEVIAEELELEGSLLDHQFKLRADRIDKLATGETLLIDYKSREYKPSCLAPAKLSEPQLPLYLLCYANASNPKTNNVAGLAFSPVMKNSKGLTGVGDPGDDKAYRGLKLSAKAFEGASWQQLREQWQSTLEATLRAYLDGNCELGNKKLFPPYWEYLAPLNRFDEQEFLKFYFSHTALSQLIHATAQNKVAP